MRSSPGGPFDAEYLTAGYSDALLVGHDPSFTIALYELTGAHARMPKGGLAGISKRELIVLLRPRELSALPAAKPVRQRVRPDGRCVSGGRA